MSAPAALERGLQVLSLLAQAREGLSFSAIATALQTSNASTMRLLQSLCELGFIERLPEQQGYRSADKVSQLSGTQSLRSSFRDAAQGFLGSLMERTGNTAISIFFLILIIISIVVA